MGRSAHVSVLVRRAVWDGDRVGFVGERRAERRRMSSRRSVGIGAACLNSDFDFVVADELVLDDVDKSRLLRAVRRKWHFEARMRAVLRLWKIAVRRDGSSKGSKVLLRLHRALFVRSGSWLSRRD